MAMFQKYLHVNPVGHRSSETQETKMQEHCTKNAAAFERQCANSTKGLQDHCGSLFAGWWSKRSEAKLPSPPQSPDNYRISGQSSVVTKTTEIIDAEHVDNRYVASAHQVLSRLRLVNHLAKGITVQTFPHDSIPIRGLGALRNFSPGEIVIKFRNGQFLQSRELQDARFRNASDSQSRIGLWLAEKKAELVDSRTELTTRQEETWAGWVKAYPTHEDLADFPQPYFTPQEVLDKWAKLPRLDVFAKWTTRTLEEMSEDIQKYNMARGTHPKMEWDTALWGKAIAHRYCFFCPEFDYWAILLPIGDLVNHGGNQSNVEFRCDRKMRYIKFKALRRLRAGDEILDTYGHLEPHRLAWHIGAFADVDAYKVEWPMDDCRKLWMAGYGSGRVESTHEADRLMDRVVRWLCRTWISEL